RLCCTRLRYVSVRNRTTLTFLRRCGFEGEVRVVPDPTLLLDVPREVDAAVDEILAASGADRSRLLVGVSPGNSLEDPRAADFYKDLLETRARMGKQAQVVLFPWSYMRGDPRLCEAAAKELPGAVVIRRRMSALELWRLIGRMGVYVAARYHSMLAAFAQNVPFIVVDEYLSDLTASSKTREFIVEHGLEPSYLCPFLGAKPSWKVAGLI